MPQVGSKATKGTVGASDTLVLLDYDNLVSGFPSVKQVDPVDLPVPGHSAAAITSGTLDAARLPTIVPTLPEYTPGTRPAASTMPRAQILVNNGGSYSVQVSAGGDWLIISSAGTITAPQVDASLTVSVDGPYIAPTS